MSPPPSDPSPDRPAGKAAGKGLLPAEALQAVEEGFFAHLRAAAPAGVRDPGALEARIRAAVAALGPRTAHLVANDLDRGNVGFVLLAVAAYEVLLPDLGEDAAARAVDDSLNQPLRRWVLEGTRRMLDHSPDPFAALVAASRDREAHYFGPSFAFEHPVDDGHGYLLNVRRCLFHETLKACGRTELQPLICRFDLNWIDALDPARHHARFVRPSTFASADLCRMWFVRLEHLAGAAGEAAPPDTTTALDR